MAKIMVKKNVRIVAVSAWEAIKVHFLAFVFGVLVISKMLVKWLWDPKSFVINQQRDNPPSCLVDSILGQHKYVKLKGVKFHYVESGSPTSPLLLLLHGFPDCWLSFRSQIPLLAPHYRVIALDLKGFGDSDKPPARHHYCPRLLVAELRQLVLALGAATCTVVGHDVGALLGWYLAHQHPELVARLVAVSAPHPNVFRTSLHTAANYQWLNFVQLPYFPEIDALKSDVNIISHYHRHLPANDTFLEAYKYSFNRKEDWSGPLNYYRNLLFVKVANECDLLQMPVILITGSKDKFIRLESIVRSSDFCEKFHVKIIDGAGHFPHQENPHKFNEILVKYLIGKSVASLGDLSPGKGVFNRMFGAVSSTVKYGGNVLDTVQKKTNGVVGSIPAINLY